MATFEGRVGGKASIEAQTIIDQVTNEMEKNGSIKFKGEIWDVVAQLLQKHVKTNSISYGAKLQDLEHHTRRIEKMFLDLAEQNDNQVEKVRDEYSGQLTTMQITINNLNTEKNELTEKANILKELTRITKANQGEVIDKVKSLIISVVELEKKVENLKFEYEKRVKGFEEKIKKSEEDTKQRISTYEKTFAMQDSRIKDKENEVSELNARLVAKDKKIKEIEQTVSKNEEYIQKIHQLEDHLAKNKETHEKILATKDFECKQVVFKKEKEIILSMNEQIREEIRRGEDSRNQLRDELWNRYQSEINELKVKYEGLLKDKDNEIKSLQILIKSQSRNKEQ